MYMFMCTYICMYICIYIYLRSPHAYNVYINGKPRSKASSVHIYVQLLDFKYYSLKQTGIL